jgi:predicted transcriptional regulator
MITYCSDYDYYAFDLSSQAVMLFLLLNTSKNGMVYLDQVEIADKMKRSRTTINKAIRDLLTRGLLESHKRGYRVKEVLGQKLA